MTRTTLTCQSDSPDATAAIARHLGARLVPGDVLLLSGDVGAGKTHFARALIQSRLNAPEDVPSPTYTLVQTYAANAAEIWHADLYRLTSATEIVELGLEEAFTTAICLVEWPDRLGDMTPGDALSITLTRGEDADVRTLTFNWSDPRWANRTDAICKEDLHHV